MPWVIVAILSTVLFGMATRRDESRVALAAPAASSGSTLAQPARTPAPQREIGSQQMITMPDGSSVATTFKGYLTDVSQLPVHGGQIGDMWAIGHNWWVLTTPANSYGLGWVDPPGDEPEVRRALPVDSVEVRRAKMVVPRAELVRELSD